MFLHPRISSQLASERRNEMLTDAQNRRLTRQVRDGARTTQPPARRLRSPLQVVGRLLAAFQP